MFTYLLCFAFFNALNGVVMIIAPEFWYQITPGASDTGPLNEHFVRDIGIAFVVAGIGLWLGVSQTVGASFVTAVIAMLFIAGHGLLHLVEMITMAAALEAVLRDFVLVVLPVLVAIVCLLKLDRRTAAHKHNTHLEKQ